MRRMRLSSTTLVIFVNLLLASWHIDYCHSHNGNNEDTSTTLPHASTSNEGVSLKFVYHNHQQISDFLRAINAKYPTLTHLESIGNSVRQKELWVLIISKSPKDNTEGLANVNYVGTIHGNEPVGGEMILHLIKYLLENQTDPQIEWLMENTRMHFLPLMNPDGYEIARVNDESSEYGRKNARNVDINRNFNDPDNVARKEPETLAVLQWMRQTPFVLSATMHGGALVVNYPYDSAPAGSSSTITPDNDVFHHLALTYAKNHPDMMDGTQNGEHEFKDGTVNGADWYTFTGGKQDCSYTHFGCMELTIEISKWKYPDAKELVDFWEVNKTSMIKLLGEVRQGVRGIVISETSSLPIHRAILKIKGRDAVFKTSNIGEFRRILLTGEYILEISALHHAPQEIPFEVYDEKLTDLYNIVLQKSKKKKGKA